MLTESGPDGNSYWALVLVFFPILTIFGNSLVVMSVIREKNLKTVTNYFVVSLAIADLTVAAAVMPFAVYYEVLDTLLQLKSYMDVIMKNFKYKGEKKVGNVKDGM